MPVVNIPPAVRFTLYLVSALGSVVAAYLFAKGLVGDAELALWAGVVAIINGLAAAKTDLHEPRVYDLEAQVEHTGRVEGTVTPADPGEPDDERGGVDIGTAVVIAILMLLVLLALGIIPGRV